MIREALAHRRGRTGAGTRGILRSSASIRAITPADLHRTVDDRPYGGGPGMVLKVEPLRSAVRAAMAVSAGGQPAGVFGRRRTQIRPEHGARGAATGRVWCWWRDATRASMSASSSSEIDEQWSIGDYVLSGGELPALVVIDAIARLMPGTLGSRGIGGAGVVQRRIGGLAALHAAAGTRRARGAGGADVGRSRGDSPLAIAAGAWAAPGCAGRSCSSGAA